MPRHRLATCKSNQGRGCTVRCWSAGVERACARLTIGSRLMAPPSAIFAAVATIRLELAAPHGGTGLSGVIVNRQETNLPRTIQSSMDFSFFLTHNLDLLLS